MLSFTIIERIVKNGNHEMNFLQQPESAKVNKKDSILPKNLLTYK